MAVFQLEDMEGSIEVLIWPRFYEKHRELLDSELPILVRGQCDVDARGDMKIICSELIELSSVCNFHCRFCCCENTKPLLGARFLPEYLPVLCAAIGRTGCHFVNLTGGEPLLLKADRLFKVIAAIALSGEIQQFWVTTNGSRLQDMDFCYRLATAGLRRLTVSIAAETDEKYRHYTQTDVTLTDILYGIKNAIIAGIQVKVHVPLNPDGISNFEQLASLIRSCEEVGVETLYYFRLHDSEVLHDRYGTLYCSPEAITERFAESADWTYAETTAGRPYFTNGRIQVQVPRESIRLVTKSCLSHGCGRFCQGTYAAYLIPSAAGWHVRACNRVFADRNNEFELDMKLLECGDVDGIAAFFEDVWKYAYEA